MKRLFLLGFLVVLLSACSESPIDDSFSAYRDKTAAELYDTATKNITKHSYEDAVKNLEALNALYPFGAHAEEGQVNLLYAYYKNDDPEEALAIADRYLRLYPRGQYADYVYYMKGVIATKQGLSWLQRKLGVSPVQRDLSNYKQAFMAFDQLVRTFPQSPYVSDALTKMRYIRNVLAMHEVDIAKFYFEQKAYVASANRASYVVKHFDGTPAVIDALGVLVQSYRALGLTKMANDTMTIFGASYSNSPIYQRLLRG